jgi:pimeloyl-ACP methyl ester carboxylesterase
MTSTAAAGLDRDGTSRTIEGPEHLHYHRAGPAAGTAPGLLLLHGSGPGVSGWANFGPNVPAFSRDRAVVIPDQPGFGASYRPDLTTPYMRTSAEAALRVLDAEGLDRVDVVGNSLGGSVAVELTLEHPDRVRRLVLMGPGGIAPPLLAPQPTEGIRLLVEFCEDPTRERLVSWMRAMVGNQRFLTEERIEERWRTASAPGGTDFVRDFYRAAMAAMRSGRTRGVPVWARLGEIAQPTLLTYGRDDRVTPLETALHPLRAIRRAELHVFGDCGHWAMQERQGDFERVVLEFLTREGPTPKETR